MSTLSWSVETVKGEAWAASSSSVVLKLYCQLHHYVQMVVQVILILITGSMQRRSRRRIYSRSSSSSFLASSTTFALPFCHPVIKLQHHKNPAVQKWRMTLCAGKTPFTRVYWPCRENHSCSVFTQLQATLHKCTQLYARSTQIYGSVRQSSIRRPYAAQHIQRGESTPTHATLRNTTPFHT